MPAVWLWVSSWYRSLLFTPDETRRSVLFLLLGDT
jgi:hypothetical protein